MKISEVTATSGQAMHAVRAILVPGMLHGAPATAQDAPYGVYRDTATARTADDPDVIGGVAEAPVLRNCAQPDPPVGTLLGSGWVTYTVLASGRMDSTTLRVDSAEGISHARVPVAVTVRHRVAFQTGNIVGRLVDSLADPRPLEEMPAVGRCKGLGSIYPTGSIQLSIVIGVDGWAKPESIEVLESSNLTLREAAPKIAWRCHYAPGRSYGEPVRVLVTQRFVFRRGR